MISIIVPVLNEEESLPAFFERILPVASSYKNSEIIFIDDGSTDKSLQLLKNFAKQSKMVRVYSFRKNLGKAEALTMGFQKAQGDIIVTLDADLQDKPEEIGKLLEKSEEGFDVVSGWRKERKDSTKKIISSKIFNAFVGKIWGLSLHDYNCGLKTYTREAGKNVRLYGGLHRFIPLLLYQQGFTVTEVPVSHDARRFGKSKFGFSKLWRDLPDIFTMLFLSRYGDRPLHFFAWFGALLVLPGMVILLYLMIMKLLGGGIGDRPILFLGMLFILSGFQVFFTGFLADIIINISKQNEKIFPIKYSTEK